MKRKMTMVALAMLFLASSSAFAERIEVQKLMTLWSIAERCGKPGVSWPEFYKNNKWLPAPEKTVYGGTIAWIQPGQVINLPEGWHIMTPIDDIVPAEAPLIDPNANFGISEPPKPDADAQQAMAKAAEKFAKEQKAEKKLKASKDFWQKTFPLILFLLCLALIGGAIHYFLGREIKRVLRNPDRHPAVVKGGLSPDSKIALQSISSGYPNRYMGNRKIKAVEQGILGRSSGPKVIVTDMVFGDGTTRKAEMKPGDRVHRVELLDGSYEYYRSHCGNLMAEIKSGQFQLPDGWFFRANRASRYEVPQPEASVEVETPVAESAGTDIVAEVPAGEPTPASVDDSRLLAPESAPSADAVVPEKTAPENAAENVEKDTSTPVIDMKFEADSEPTVYTVSVTIDDGKGKYIVSAVASAQESMPTKVERITKPGEDKLVILFPRDRGTQEKD